MGLEGILVSLLSGFIIYQNQRVADKLDGMDRRVDNLEVRLSVIEHCLPKRRHDLDADPEH